MQTKETTTLNNIQAYAYSSPQELERVIQALQRLKGLREEVVALTQAPLFGREEAAKPQPTAPARPEAKLPPPPRPLRRSRRSMPRPGSCRETVYGLLAQGVCKRRLIIPRLAEARQVSLEQAEGLTDTILCNPRDPFIRRIATGVYKVLQPKRFLHTVPSPAESPATGTPEPQHEAQAA